MEGWPSDEAMMKLAMENNLSETAFIVKEEQGYHLRWFTPGTEVELCGHATLASSYVILNFYEPNSDLVQFNTLSGVLTVRRSGKLYQNTRHQSAAVTCIVSFSKMGEFPLAVKQFS